MNNSFPANVAVAALCAVCVLIATGCSKQPEAGSGAPPTTIGTEVDDVVIATKVKTALATIEGMNGLQIKVDTNKGVVMLSGFADNQEQLDRSIVVAKGVPGVTAVDNQMSLKQGVQSAGNKIDDSLVTARVKAALLADDTMKSIDIAVATRKGEVQLSGFVDNDAQLARAMDISKAVEGVGSVVNHMSLKK
ncbi:hyperosmotically inducible protein [Actimicrobium sp. GrIS 1.19]|uniref:BON domain-containing protein n=1 Tax=Actimicrobium sp. GrIS 1.19 TaxID=3071708 RepID=UPI002E0A5978|nr:hyperosmotically inducible protein [Actimicrobium sp. GrIS 1.19]